MDSEKKSMLKDALILFAITLAAGLLLGFVHDVTKEPIAEQKAKAKAEACRNVFADADSFEALAAEDGPTAYFMAGQDSNVDIDEVMRALDSSGQLLGYVITVTDHEGYGGDIQFSMGVTLDGTLNGISLLNIKETAGLGMKAKEPAFYGQYEGKQAEKFVVSKDGGDGEPIDALSGATITSRAVTDAVNAALGYYQSVFQ